MPLYTLRDSVGDAMAHHLVNDAVVHLCLAFVAFFNGLFIPASDASAGSLDASVMHRGSRRELQQY